MQPCWLGSTRFTLGDRCDRDCQSDWHYQLWCNTFLTIKFSFIPFPLHPFSHYEDETKGQHDGNEIIFRREPSNHFNPLALPWNTSYYQTRWKGFSKISLRLISTSIFSSAWATTPTWWANGTWASAGPPTYPPAGVQTYRPTNVHLNTEQPPPSEASTASPGTTQAQSTTSATYGTRATTSGKTRTWTLGHGATTQLICSTKKRYSDLSLQFIWCKSLFRVIYIHPPISNALKNKTSFSMLLMFGN